MILKYMKPLMVLGLVEVDSMKHLLNLYECIIIVVLAPIILLPEMAYFVYVRAIEKAEMMVGEL